MKLSNLLLFLAALFPVVASAQSNLPPVGDDWEAKYTNGIAAIVNERVITVDYLRNELRPLVPQIRIKAMTREEFDKRLEEVSFEILRNLIDRILIVEDFNKQGMQIPKVYVEKEYDDYIVQNFKGDRVAFHDWLRKEGKTPREFREDLKDKMIVDYMRNKMRKTQSAVSPVRIEEYYEANKNQFFEKERIHLYQIMLAPIANEPESVLVEQARKLIAEIKGGAAFEDVAKKYSQDDKRKSGGDWGWIERTELTKELADVAFKMPEGDFSEPMVKSGYVFILHVREKRSEGIQPLSKVKTQIEDQLAGEIARKAQKLWLDRLRQTAYIRYYL